MALFTGTIAADFIVGTEENDLIIGRGGDDTLAGADGNDNIRGNRQNDRIFGGEDNDRLSGGQGRDILNGGDGNDRFIWGPRDLDQTGTTYGTTDVITDFQGAGDPNVLPVALVPPYEPPCDDGCEPPPNPEPQSLFQDLIDLRRVDANLCVAGSQDLSFEDLEFSDLPNSGSLITVNYIDRYNNAAEFTIAAIGVEASEWTAQDFVF